MNRATELGIAFLETQPAGAARVLDQIPPADAAAFLADAPENAATAVLGYMQPACAAAVLGQTPPAKSAALLSGTSARARSVLLRILPANQMADILAALPRREAARMRRYLAYNAGTVGAWMDAPRASFPEDTTVKDCLAALRGLGRRLGSAVYAVNAERRLLGIVDIDELLNANDKSIIGDVMEKGFVSLSPQALLTTVVSQKAWDSALSLPVVDRNRHLVGVLHFDSLREGLVADRGPVDTAPVSILLSHLLHAFAISVSGLLQTATTTPPPTRLTDDGER